jgi:DNA replication and repair protein RecF
VIPEEKACGYRKSSVQRLSVSDFRNYSSADVDLAPGHNVFVGRNGQGKSNLLEAIYALATTRSFRYAKDADVIRHGAQTASISAVAGEESVVLSLSYVRGGWRHASVFGGRVPKVQDIVGRMPAVCFSSADLRIVSGEPADRRKFLDTEISLVSPAYLGAFSRYKKALEHRNAVLRKIREGEASFDALEPWDVQVAKSGAILRAGREAYLAELNRLAAEKHLELSDSAEKLDLAYQMSDEASSENDLLEALCKRRAQDVGAGFTTVGPHRDDLVVTVDSAGAKEFASQGQQRTAVLAIKMAVALYWRNELRTVPIMLLDDIMSDLDERRRNLVMSVSGSLGQIVITATDIGQLLPELRSGAKVFEVANGTISEK